MMLKPGDRFHYTHDALESSVLRDQLLEFLYGNRLAEQIPLEGVTAVVMEEHTVLIGLSHPPTRCSVS